MRKASVSPGVLNIDFLNLQAISLSVEPPRRLSARCLLIKDPSTQSRAYGLVLVNRQSTINYF